MEPLEQESDRIERHIEQTREKLGRNLNELESRVRTTLDWRTRYERNPWAVLGLAFGAGAALAAANSRRLDRNPTPTTPAPPSRFSKAWGQIQDALLSTATRQAETFPRPSLASPRSIAKPIPAPPPPPAAPATYSAEEIQCRVSELGPWFHNLQLGGIATAPHRFLGDYPSV